MEWSDVVLWTSMLLLALRRCLVDFGNDETKTKKSCCTEGIPSSFWRKRCAKTKNYDDNDDDDAGGTGGFPRIGHWVFFSPQTGHLSVESCSRLGSLLSNTLIQFHRSTYQN